MSSSARSLLYSVLRNSTTRSSGSQSTQQAR
jgi:hypothetical protein